MFADAIEKVARYTRAVRTIQRCYKSTTVIPGAATLFFVNEEGVAITCRHVASLLFEADRINLNYQKFQKERAELPADHSRKAALKRLEQKYNLTSNVVVQQKNRFVDCIDKFIGVKAILHSQYDLAILQFDAFENILYNGHVVLAKDGNAARPGDFLCRLGFPFPEYSDYQYDQAADDINWTEDGNHITPQFPIEGMFTRHISGNNHDIAGIELSTPGLRGQSGGPLFDAKGVVFGIQSATNHLHLGFDMKNKSMMINGQNEVVNNQPFLHVGHCVHVDIIKSFLDENKIKYYVGDSLDNEEVVNG